MTLNLWFFLCLPSVVIIACTTTLLWWYSNTLNYLLELKMQCRLYWFCISGIIAIKKHPLTGNTILTRDFLWLLLSRCHQVETSQRIRGKSRIMDTEKSIRKLSWKQHLFHKPQRDEYEQESSSHGKKVHLMPSLFCASCHC